MDIISFNEAATANGRIEIINANPDSTSGIVTVPKTIASGETVTIPAGRVAVLPNVQVDGTLNVEGEVFIPSGATFGDLESQIALKADTSYVNNKYSGFKNYIINGGFDIDQRNNKVGILIPAGGYAFTADRWLVSNTTNQPVNITVSDFPTNSGGRTGRLQIKFDTAPTTGSVQVFQKIENVAVLGGKVVTLSQSLACDAMTIGTDLAQNFGTGGSSNVVTDFSSINTTGILSSLTRFSSSITVPSIEGKTIGANSYTQITYNLPIRTTNIQTIAQVQLEKGSVATPFENRPIGLELSLCQRYYEKILTSIRAYADGAGFYWTIPMKVNKRNTPTIIQGTSFSGQNVSSSTSVVAIFQENITYRLIPVSPGFCTMDNLSLEIVSEL